MFHPLYPTNQGRHSPGDVRLIKKEKEDQHHQYNQFLTVAPMHHYRKPTSLSLDKPRLSKMGRRSSPDLRNTTSDVLQQLHVTVMTSSIDDF